MCYFLTVGVDTCSRQPSSKSEGCHTVVIKCTYAEHRDNHQSRNYFDSIIGISKITIIGISKITPVNHPSLHNLCYFWIACNIQNWRGKAWSFFYHVSDVNVYINRQKGGGVPSEGMHFAHAFFVPNNEFSTLKNVLIPVLGQTL